MIKSLQQFENETDGTTIFELSHYANFTIIVMPFLVVGYLLTSLSQVGIKVLIKVRRLLRTLRGQPRPPAIGLK